MTWQPTHRHYKGGLYRVLEVDATHSETLETLVVYESEKGAIWCRPKEMFYGALGHGTKRFTPLPDLPT